MVRFLLQRGSSLLITMAIVSVAVFALTEIAPGNIATNTLGNNITPAQEESFNKQNGLDQSPVTRYIRWIAGSDWEAARAMGEPVQRLYDESNRRYSWWRVEDDGALTQHYSPDGSQMVERRRQPDGGVEETLLPDTVWQPDPADPSRLIFWGVNPSNRAAMWIKGAQTTEWTPQAASWTSALGAPDRYIPLQRGLLRGDPGVSFLTRRPVNETLGPRLRNTGILAGLAFAVVMPLALALGVIAGLNEGRWLDRTLTLGGLVTTATPEFVSGTLLVLILSQWLGLFPGAVVLTNESALFSNPKMLVLPVLTLTLAELGYVLRITRTSMVEVMRTNYIRTAVLKGLPRWRIVFRHALRNALMAPITVIMLHVNWLVGGIVIVESVFGFPGLGSYILDAALFKDVYVIEAATMALILVAVGTQLLADIVYTFLNPRIRFA
jgi:peptide/nickel transport system permease protein